jgi:hypothetical protein
MCHHVGTVTQSESRTTGWKVLRVEVITNHSQNTVRYQRRQHQVVPSGASASCHMGRLKKMKRSSRRGWQGSREARRGS